MFYENIRIKNKEKNTKLDQRSDSVKSKLFLLILKWFGKIFGNNAVIFYLFQKMLN